jgi:RNA-binding protein
LEIVSGMKELSSKQKSHLRALAHALDPVVQVGKAGLTESVLAQVRDQIRAHELIKVRFNKECESQPEDAAPVLATSADCHVVQKAGRVLTLYKRHDHKPKIELPR